MTLGPEVQGKIVNYVKINGPVLPVKISKEVDCNILFAGAILSELVRKQEILISSAKIGGSPVYYAKGQENKLSMLSEYLNEKEKKAFELIREKKNLEDSKLNPWQRVAMREIKDFAIPFKDSEGKLFWRWYLSDETKSEVKSEPEKIVEPVPEKLIKPEPKRVVKESIKKENQEVLEPVKEKPKVEPKAKPSKEDPFKNSLFNYFSKKNVNILEEVVIRKKTDYEFIAEIPSDIGIVKFFIKVRGKKNISDADLSLALDKSSSQKLPLYFLSTGDLTKKAIKYMESNNLKFEKLISS